ncbi:MAG: penicillin-binding transpeptidase domain-containing protein, partial [bacterium]
KILAESVDTESVFCSPGLVKPWRRAALARVLASTLGLNEAGLRHRLAEGRPFWVVRGAKIETVDKLKARKLVAVSYEAQTRRVYPQGTLAAHVLGYTNVDGAGLDGVELSYQKVLAGKPGECEVLRDAAGRRVANQQVWVRRPQDGAGLRLTLDSDLQHIAERELRKAWLKYHAKGGAIIVMDPYTGEILAMASMPDFDPGRAGSFSQNARWNRAIGDAFEPGSTFKVVTAALALERGVVTPNTPVNCHEGRAEFFGRVVKDYGADHLGVVPFSTVLADSSNIGTVEVALKLGAQVLYNGMTRFGFGLPTGVDLPGEVVGSLRPVKEWGPSAMAAVPFGQSFSTTLIRILVTYAAVANGGRLVRPHVVQEIIGGSGSENAPEANSSSSRIMGETVRRELVKILEGVVERGTGVAISLPGYAIAGKTGTAQKFDLVRHRYSKTASVSSFVGFVPAEAPVFVAAVMLDEPRGLDLGGWTSGPVFRSVMSAALTAYGVAPSESVRKNQEALVKADERKGDWTAMYKRGALAETVSDVEVPELRGSSERAARLALAKEGLRVWTRGRGRVLGQFPRAGSEVLQNSTVTLALGSESTAGSDRASAPASKGFLARLWTRP